MMGGQVASLVSPGHDGKLYISALFPLTLLLLTRGIRDGKRWSWGALALVIGLAVVSPHPQLLQYLLLASAAYALFLAISAAKSEGSHSRVTQQSRLGLCTRRGCTRRTWWERFSICQCANTSRGRHVRAGSPTTRGRHRMRGRRASSSTRICRSSREFSTRTGARAASIFTATTSVSSYLIIAGAAFAGLRASPRRREIWFWTGTLIVATLWALGGHTPFYRIPYAIIPGTKFFRAPNSVFFVGSFAIAFLSAAGIERALDRQVGRKYLYGWLGFARGGGTARDSWCFDEHRSRPGGRANGGSSNR